MALRILTDEDISPTVARRLLQLGYDVLPVHDRGLLGWEDWDLMRWCIQNQRTICTVNGDDFEKEHRRCRLRGEDHYGVLIVGDWTTEEDYWALKQYLDEDPDRTLVNQVVSLLKATPQYIAGQASQ